MIFEGPPRSLYIDSEDIIWEHNIDLDEMCPLDFRGKRILLEEGDYPTLEQLEVECQGQIKPCAESDVLLKYCKVLEEKIGSGES